MSRYYFCENEIEEGFAVSFLCGAKYKEKDASDKRNVLKAHIESLDPINRVIILEERFDFSPSNKSRLSYDDIFLKNLRDVETLTAFYSDYVFIIHESNSTAAELGLFSTDATIRKKLCLLVPNKDAVEEDKISNFIRLAFFRDCTDIVQISFFPAVETWRLSVNKSDYRTYFVKDEVGSYISKGIIDFLDSRRQGNRTVKFRQARFGNFCKDHDSVSYYINETGEVSVQIPPMVLRAQIIALFNISEFKHELRISKSLYDHVSCIENWYKDVLSNTLEMKEGRVVNKLSIGVKGTDTKVRVALAYMVYLLQAMQFVELHQHKTDARKRDFEIRVGFMNLCEKYLPLISERIPSTFKRIIS